MLMNLRWAASIMILTALGGPVSADVITDWNEKAIALVTKHRMLPPQAERVIACVHVAMFDAVNSIEGRYRPYRVALSTAKGTSKQAAAAVAAAMVLTKLFPNDGGELNSLMAADLMSIPQSSSKSDGIKLGQEVALRTIADREGDGADAPDAYRPKTRPGVYVPTPITASSMWPNVKPFAMTSPLQFRPAPPIALGSAEWAADYNEIKTLGGKSSSRRTARQTEDANFWLITGPASYYPIVRQLVTAKKMDLVDSARFMALASTAVADTYIAVFDAKYHYEFWRPITAIRNGDNDGNPATELEASWQPIANTPMHPEYPCAHCIQSGSVAGVVKAVFGTTEIPEIAMTSPTAPGVTRRWVNMTAFTEEVANARIWSGFHYRFSTRVGTEMGYQIGEYVVKKAMQPVVTSSR